MKKPELPVEIWAIIAGFCSIKACIRLSQTSKSFYNLIYNFTTPSILVTLRRRLFPSIPDPPSHISETTFLDLLMGKGCQNCHTPFTRKVYWEFWRRLCSDCLNSMSIRSYQLQTSIDYVPYIEKSSWTRWGGESNYKIYLIDDIAALERERNEVVIDDQWRMQKQMNFITTFNRARLIDVLLKTLKLQDQVEKEKTREQRCIDLNSRIDEAGYNMRYIKYCQAYKNARKNPNPLTERAWMILKTKLEEHIRRCQEEDHKYIIRNQFKKDLCDRVKESKGGIWTNHSSHIIQQIIDKCPTYNQLYQQAIPMTNNLWERISHQLLEEVDIRIMKWKLSQYNVDFITEEKIQNMSRILELKTVKIPCIFSGFKITSEKIDELNEVGRVFLCEQCNELQPLCVRTFSAIGLFSHAFAVHDDE